MESSKVREIQQIEEIQKNFTRKIRSNRRDDDLNWLKTYHLYSLQRRRERYRIICVLKILERLVPNLAGRSELQLKHRCVLEGFAPCLHVQLQRHPDYRWGVSTSTDHNYLIPFPHISKTWQELRHWSSRRNWTSFCWLLLMNHYHLVTQLVVELLPTAYCTWYLLVVDLYFVFDGVP